MEIITFEKDDVIATSTTGELWEYTNCGDISGLF